MTPDQVLEFWVNEVGPERWYAQDDALDNEIRERFEKAWQEARDKFYHNWACRPLNMLSLIILLDQFPRNMFRGTAKAYSTDALALKLSKKAVELRHDRKVEGDIRQFFYMPMMHSEVLMDQEKCVRLFSANMPGSGSIPHAKAHREIIRRFGRFPFRNRALGRTSTPAEQKFLAESGYADVLRQIEAAGQHKIAV